MKSLKALITIYILLCAFFFNLGLCKSNNDIQDEDMLDSIIEQATIHYNNAIDLYKEDDVDKSIELFNKAIELKPDFYEAHYNLAQILMSLNKNDEAIKSLEEIEKLKPNNSENLYNLGKTYYKKGYLSKAYKSLTQITPNDAQYESAKILINKIEKRQDELNLESKINTEEKTLDSQGKHKAVVLSNFSAPSGITVDNRGNIYIASFPENQIYKISINGEKTLLSNSTLIQGPIGLAIDKDDNIYIANYHANNIIKITPNNMASVFADVNKPYCLTYDKIHNRIYVTEQFTNNLIKFDL